MKSSLVATLIVAGISSGACAEGAAAVVGYGAMSCSRLAEMYRLHHSSTEKEMSLYMLGYLSGLNDAQAMVKRGDQMRDLAGVSRDGMMNAVRAVCDQKPLAPVFGIMGDYWISLPRVKPGRH